MIEKSLSAFFGESCALLLLFFREIPRVKAAPGFGKVSPKDLVDQMTFVVYFSTGRHNFIQLNCD